MRKIIVSRLIHKPLKLQAFMANFKINILDICIRGHIEQVCCKKRQKCLSQENVLRNRGHLKVLFDTKLVLNEPDLGSIWYHLEPLESILQTSFLVETFFAVS